MAQAQQTKLQLAAVAKSGDTSALQKYAQDLQVIKSKLNARANQLALSWGDRLGLNRNQIQPRIPWMGVLGNHCEFTKAFDFKIHTQPFKLNTLKQDYRTL